MGFCDVLAMSARKRLETRNTIQQMLTAGGDTLVAGTLAAEVEGAATRGVVDVVNERIVSAMLDCATELATSVEAAGVVDAMTSDVVVGGCAAAAVAKLPVRVVRDRGTAVHRWPSIVVMKNPAGRFALVDMMEMKGDTSRGRECTIQMQENKE